MLATTASFFVSCSTTEKQRGKALRFFQEHPQEAAAYCGNEFPPKVILGKDSIVHDTTITPGKEVECPPVVIKTDKGKDSIIYRYVKCPPDTSTKTIKTRVDTIENTAKIVSLQFKQDSLITLLGVRTTERDKADKQSKNRLFYLLALITVIGVESFIIIRKIV